MAEEATLIQQAIGSYIAQADRGSSATVNVTNVRYENVAPRPVDAVAIQAAQQQLAALPLERIPDVSPLPVGSRMLFAHNFLFVGRRSDLHALARILKGSATSGQGQIAAITGLGGMGKTQLASEFVHRYGHYFAGGVFFLSFAEAAVVPAEIAACRTALTQELPLNIESLPLNEQVLFILGAWQNALPRLLVFDNCEEESLLTRWRPPSGGCRILLTSRRAKWEATLGVQTIPLWGLQREESLAMLQLYRPDLSRADAEVLSNELGDHPLALHLAGSFLSRYRATRFATPPAYLAQLRQATPLQHASLQGRGASYSVTSHEQNVERTFAVSYERLDTTSETDREALQVLVRVATLAPGEPIPRELVYATLPPAKNEVEGELAFEDAVERLSALGLLQSQEDGTLRLHHLLAAFVQMRLGATEREKVQRAVERVVLEIAQRSNKSRDPTPLLLMQPHLQAVTDRATERADVLAAGLCEELGTHLRMIGSYELARTYIERGLAIRKQILGPVHPDTAQSLNSLGILSSWQGQYEQAEPLFLRALAIRERILGPEHPDTATSLDNLGSLLHRHGNYGEAEPLFLRALAIRERILGSEHPDTAASLFSLAQTYNGQEKYEQAEELLKRALSINERVLGPEHPDTAANLNSLALLYSRQGKYTEAEPLFLRALAIRERIPGSEHPDTATILSELGLLYTGRNKYEQAEELLKRALSINERVLGPKHPNTALSLSTLANTYIGQEKYEQAEELLKRALSINERVLGPKHPDTAAIVKILALLYLLQGKYKQAMLLAAKSITTLF